MRKKGKRRRMLILEKASKLFGKYGYAKCSMREIASAAGITKSALYHYFPSKEELFGQVISMESERFLTETRQRLEKLEDPAEKLRAFFETRYEKIWQVLTSYRITEPIAIQLLPTVAKYHRQILQREAQLLETILQEGIRRGRFRPMDSKSASVVMILAVKGFDYLMILDKTLFPEQEGRNLLLDIFFEGIMSQAKE